MGRGVSAYVLVSPPTQNRGPKREEFLGFPPVVLFTVFSWKGTSRREEHDVTVCLSFWESLQPAEAYRWDFLSSMKDDP